MALLALVPASIFAATLIVEQRRMAGAVAEAQALRIARLAATQYAATETSALQFLDVLSRFPEIVAARAGDCPALLADLLARHPAYIDADVVAFDGRVLCRGQRGATAPAAEELRDIVARLRTRNVIAGSYRIDPAVGEARIAYVHRLPDVPTRPSAFLRAVMDTAWLTRVARDAELPAHSMLALFDLGRVLLAAVPPSPDNIGRVLAPAPGIEAALARRAEGTTAGVGADGVARFYAYVPLEHRDSSALYVTVGLPQSDAYASVAELERKIVFGAVLMAIALFIIVSKAADLLVLRHVNALLRAAERLGGGELSARSGVPRHEGEMHQLARTFDEMAEALQTREAESRAAQEALRQSEARFRRLAENAPDVIYRYRLGADPGYEYISPAVEKMFGYAPQEFYADPALGARIVHPDDRATLANITRGRVPETVEARWIRKDGRVLWIEQRNVPVYDANGRRIAIEGVARDITARKQGEDELKLLQAIALAVSESEDMDAGLSVVLRAVCESTGWAIGQAWVPTDDGRKLRCSRAWYALEPGLEEFRAACEAWVVDRAGVGVQAVVARERRPIWLHDLAEQPNFGRRAHAIKAGLNAMLVVPVSAGNDLEALIEFFMRESRPEDERLVRTVYTVAAQVGALIRRKRSEERLTYLAHHDVLTGLANRALFSDRLRHALVEANRQSRLVAVAFLDLDRFKDINDSLGHETGDQLLRGVAARLASSIRESDTVARISGDEFMLVLPGLAQVDDAARVAQKILASLRTPFAVGGQELFVSASLGLAIYPHDAKDVDSLLRNADVAMYRAKDTGRNAYHFYAAEMTQAAQERLNLEGALRRAIERDEFLLHYQPILDSASGAVVGVEALMRWRHPERGLIDPAQFIPLAEETGMIVPLGEWALAAACAECRAWERAGLGELRLAVNISPRQFQSRDLAAMIAAVLNATGLPAARLELELTESVLLHNLQQTIANMERLADLGVRLCLDDFGTGYSSLSYLKRFPIDQLKIDRSFVRDIPDDKDDAAIATAIIAMAHNLELRVIAEGVETIEQAQYLRARDCDAMQGNYFSAALSSEALVEWLRARPHAADVAAARRDVRPPQRR